MSAVHATPIYPETATNAANATATHFDIVVTIETDPKDGSQYCVPRNIPKVMHPGDTVTYVSPNGLVTITFQKDSSGLYPPPPKTSPYVDAAGNDLPTVQGGVVLNVQNRGDYFGECSLTDPVTKKAIYWHEDASGSVSAKQSDYQSGGNHVVK